MVGEAGKALTVISPERIGRVAAHGEIWNASAEEPIPEGSRVRITGVDRLTLVVRRD
jgi:membrane-bound ClpP family serine protease